MKKLRAGFVGAGRGSVMGAGFKDFGGDVELVAHYDVNPEAMNRLADALGVEHRPASYEELLALDLDIVGIGAPMPYQADMAAKALRSGANVLSEVTGAVNLAQCVELVRAVRESGKQYMLSENTCFFEDNLLVTELVKRGLFGETYFAEGEYVHEVRFLFTNADGTPTWRAHWAAGVDGNTYCTHSLGPCLQWLGERIEWVSCAGSGRWTVPQYIQEDTNLTLGKTESGKLVKLRLDLISNRPPAGNLFTLQGTEGCYESGRGPTDAPRIWLKEHSAAPVWRPLAELKEDFLPKKYLAPVPEAMAGHGISDYWVIRSFLEAVLEGSKPPFDVYESLDMTAPGLVSQQSILKGGVPLHVPNFRQMPDADPYGWLQEQTSIVLVPEPD